MRKSLDEIKAAQKAQHRLLEEVAELQAERMLQAAEASRRDYKLVVQFFADRDLGFIKMLAQKLTHGGRVRSRCWLRRRAAVAGLRADAGLATTWAR